MKCYIFSLNFGSYYKIHLFVILLTIQKKIKESALRYLYKKIIDRDGKGRGLNYSKVEIQCYLSEATSHINHFEEKKSAQKNEL